MYFGAVVEFSDVYYCCILLTIITHKPNGVPKSCVDDRLLFTNAVDALWHPTSSVHKMSARLL